MKRPLVLIGIILIVLLALTVIFVLWGSSKTVSDEEYAEGLTIKGPEAPAEETATAPESGKDTYSIMTYNVGYASGMANSLA
ncbi:MAG: hypothetical protein ACLFMZ_10330, partial [Spirochaetaceae bacterium]